MDRRKMQRSEEWKSQRSKKKRRSEERKVQKKETQKPQAQEKVEKSPFSVFLQWFVILVGRKVGSKAVGAEPFGHMRDETCHAFVARSTFSS